MSNKHLIFIIFNYQLLFSLWQGRYDRRAAIPFVLKKHASLCRVAGLRIAQAPRRIVRRVSPCGKGQSQRGSNRSRPSPKLLRSPSPLSPQPSTESYGGAPQRPPPSPRRKSRAPRMSGPGNSSPSLRSRRQYHTDGWARQTKRARAPQRARRGGGDFLFSAGACTIASLSAVKRGGTGAGASAGAAACGAGAAACGAGAGTLDFFWRRW